MSFISQGLSYWIHDTSITIKIQIGKDNFVHSEINYTFEQMVKLSPYFNQFPSIKEITQHLLTLAENDKIICQETDNSFELALNITKDDQLLNIILFIPKEPVEIRVDHLEKKMNNRLDSLEELLKKQIDLIETMNIRLKKIDEQLLHQMDNKLHSQSQNENIQNVIMELSSIDQKTEKSIEKVDISPSLIKRPAFIRRNTIANQSHSKLQLQLQLHQTKAIPQQINESIRFLNKNEKTMINEWIAQQKSFKWKLIYHPVNGSDTEEECINKFYNQSPILILIKTTKGCRFGGYTSVGFDTPGDKGSWKVDENAFLFSIDKKKKYPIQKAKVKNAIRCETGTIGRFFCGLWLDEGFMTSNDNWTGLFSYGNNEPKYEHNNGSDHFTVESLYVYHIVNN